MKIRRLEIQGFKSFADRTVLSFGEGITGVVGPNGCGKSNIVDAIRWVMGEQSAKHLRGAGMQDVIFAGSERRGPGGMAEVTLSFKNDGSLVPDDYRRFDEISITRRLFRDGTSEYAINRVSCRLRDILDLFMGTGVGKNAYSIIEQGRIGLIVTAKPEDRRAVIEDAAGVSRYKARRKQAERRIEATEQNLLRVKDITDELEKRLGTLERQAKKAERYRKMKEELRALDLHGGVHRFLELLTAEHYETSTIEALRASIHEVESSITEDEAAILGALEAASAKEEALRGRESDLHENQQALALRVNNVEFLRREFEKLQERRCEAEREQGGLREELAGLTEQREAAGSLHRELQSTGGDETEALANRVEALRTIEAQVREAQAEADREKQATVEVLTSVARHRSNLANLERSALDLDTRIRRSLEGKKQAASRLREGRRNRVAASADLASQRQAREALDQTRADHEQELAAVRAERSDVETDWQAAKQSLMSKRSRLGSLLEIQRNYEGCNDAVRSIMRPKHDEPRAKPHGLVADFVSAEPRFEAAVEAVLGDRLQSVVVACQEDGISSIEYLKQSAAGRSSFVPLDLREDHVSWAPRPATRRPAPRSTATVGALGVSDAPHHAWTANAEDTTPDDTAPTGLLSALPIPEYVESPSHVWQGSAADVQPAGDDLTVSAGAPFGWAVARHEHEISHRATGTHGEVRRQEYEHSHSDGHGHGDDLWPPMDAPGVIGKLIDLVRAAPGYEHVARVLLGDVVIVEQLEQARRLWQENGHRKRLVTLSGEVLEPVGVLAGGSSDGVSSGMLAQKREIKELTQETSALENSVATLGERLSLLKARAETLDQSLRQVAKDSHQAELAIVRLEQLEKKLDGELAREDREIRSATDELATLRGKRDTLAAERETTRQALDALEGRQAVLEELVTTRVMAVEALRREAQSAAHDVTELKVLVASNTERRENAARDLQRLIKRIADVEERQLRLTDLERSSGEECERLAENIERGADEARALEEVVAEGRTAVQAERTLVESEQQELRQREAEVRSRRRQIDESKTELNDAIVRRRELQINRDNLEQRMRERYNLDAREVVFDYHLCPLQRPEDQAQAERLRGQVDRLGPINLTAIDEYAEVSQRYEFLAAQKKDLEQAIGSLRTAIRKINKTSRERYLEAFRLVNEKFQQVFPRLFNGGSASLVMLDESDPLESGIEMLAQPPGKKLQSVTLLSGGEKALTAVALIFSIFLIKPTPFCLLDEVDAPLDEANVGRYNEMVHDMSSISQFILITHNKKTMELPDRLYGVTMEDPGVSKIVPVDVVGSARPLRAVS